MANMLSAQPMASHLTISFVSDGYDYLGDLMIDAVTLMDLLDL